MHTEVKVPKIICTVMESADSMVRNSMKMLIQSGATMKKGKSTLENIRNDFKIKLPIFVTPI